MKLLNLSLDGAAENLALDEALLEDAERATEPREVLRIWEPDTTMVVVGRSSRVKSEVDMLRCNELGIPVFRRTSGGAAIVTGPGCLMYAVILSYDLRPALRSIDETHCFVLNTLAGALGNLVTGVQIAGTSDLAVGSHKFSGNSLRCKRTHLLYHGTLLYDFPLSLISTCLKSPPRQPVYRQGRDHDQFVTNLPLARQGMEQALANAWRVESELTDWPRHETYQLAQHRYQQAEWNLSR